MAEYSLNARLVHCAYTAAQWATDANKVKVLKKGELGLEIALTNDVLTSCKIKVGDGTTQWQSLPYALDSVFTAAEKTKLAGITASADSVSFTQTKTSGTELGKITINGTAYSIYSDAEKDTVTKIRYATSGVDLTTSYQTGEVTLGAAAAKQVDTTPTASSTNLITSGGVVAYIDTELADAITALGLGAASKKGVDTSVSSSSTDNNVPTSKAVWSAIASGIAANDAMVYKGVIAGTSSSPGGFTAAANRGHTYRVSTAGYINGVKVEIGDMFICLTDNTAAATSSNYATIQNNWSVIQTNIDGAVIGPASAVASRVAVFGDTSGKVIKDSGYTIAANVPSGAKFTDTTYSQATSSALGLVKIGYTASGKNYPVALNSSGQMYVNVPWTDTNTTYTGADILGMIDDYTLVLNGNF